MAAHIDICSTLSPAFTPHSPPTSQTSPRRYCCRRRSPQRAGAAELQGCKVASGQLAPCNHAPCNPATCNLAPCNLAPCNPETLLFSHRGVNLLGVLKLSCAASAMTTDQRLRGFVSGSTSQSVSPKIRGHSVSTDFECTRIFVLLRLAWILWLFQCSHI